MSYFEAGNTLPPPFNLLPSPKRIMRLFCRNSNSSISKLRRTSTKVSIISIDSMITLITFNYIIVNRVAIPETTVMLPSCVPLCGAMVNSFIIPIRVYNKGQVITLKCLFLKSSNGYASQTRNVSGYRRRCQRSQR